MGRLHALKLVQLAGEGDIVFAGIFDRDPARACAVADELGVPLLATLVDVFAAAAAAVDAVVGLVDYGVVEILILESGLA